MITVPQAQMNLKEAAKFLGVGETHFREHYMPNIKHAKGRGEKSRTKLFRAVDLLNEMNKDYEPCEKQEKDTKDYTKTRARAYGASTKQSEVSEFEKALAQKTSSKQKKVITK